MYVEEFQARLSKLRNEKGVSARDMSLSIGQNPGYIHNIENGKALPSMSVFFFICDYLGISPSEFFDVDNKPTKGYIGFAKKSYTYNDKGHLLSERYLDVNNKLVIVDDIAGNNYKRDGHGNIIELYPIGIDEKMAKGKLLARYRYDEKDTDDSRGGDTAPAIGGTSMGYLQYLKQRHCGQHGAGCGCG